LRWTVATMTQHEANLRYWTRKCINAPTFEIWRMCQYQVDAIWRAMGCQQCPAADVVDETCIFPQIRAGFEERAKRLAEAA
jgi:hypothetical protein